MYLISLEIGVTSFRAIVFGENQNIIISVQKEFTQIYPRKGWE